MVNLAALRQYAQKTDLTTLPASVLFSHTPTSLTIFDAFPKSMFHFLVIPRVLPAPAGPKGVIDVETIPVALKASQLNDLWMLLKNDKLRAKDMLSELHEDAMKVCNAALYCMAIHE
jgi:aprataxin